MLVSPAGPSRQVLRAHYICEPHRDSAELQRRMLRGSCNSANDPTFNRRPIAAWCMHNRFGEKLQHILWKLSYCPAGGANAGPPSGLQLVHAVGARVATWVPQGR